MVCGSWWGRPQQGRINNNRSRQQVGWLIKAFAGAGLDVEDDFS